MKKTKIILSITAVMFCIISGCNKKNSDIDISSTEVASTIIQETTIKSIPSATEAATTIADIIMTPVSSAPDVQKEEETKEKKKLSEEEIFTVYGGEDAARLGVDKSIVWVVPMGWCPNENAVTKINELLVTEYGCDFVVEFHVYQETMDYTVLDMMDDLERFERQADIIYSGNSDNYDKLVEQGVYIPLTEYFGTEDGQKLYNAYAPEIWNKTVINGENYGYFSQRYPSRFAAAICNTAIAKKYNVTIHGDEWSFYDVGRYLKEAGITGESVGKEEVIICAEPDALLLMEGYYELASIGTGILFKEDGKGEYIAVNPAKEEAFVKLVRTVKEYSDNGWYSCMYNGEFIRSNQAYVNSHMGRFIFNFKATDYVRLMVTDTEYVCADDSICEITMGKKAYDVYERMNNMVNGVAASSKYKEEALKFMMLTQTEAKLSNLLEYGVEGEDYIYENGILTSLAANNPIELPEGLTGLANMNILHNVLADPDDKLAYSKEISANFKPSPNVIYDLDMSAYDKQLKDIDKVYSKYKKILFKAQSDDVNATIEEMNKALEESGINEVLAALNRQMKGE